MVEEDLIIWFKDCSFQNEHLVGGKCSSLGELYKLSKQMLFSIADGFAITIKLYNEFIVDNALENFIIHTLNSIDYNNINDLNEKSHILKPVIQSVLL